MATEPSHLGRLLKDYLFLLDKKETQMAEAIGLSPNKVSAALHGRYHFKRDHLDRIVGQFAAWDLQLTAAAHDELLLAWRSSIQAPQSTPQAAQVKLQVPRAKRRTWRGPPKSGRFGEDPRLLPGPLPKLVEPTPGYDDKESLYIRVPSIKTASDRYHLDRLLRGSRG